METKDSKGFQLTRFFISPCFLTKDMISYHHLEILISATFVKSTSDKLPLWNVINLTPCWGPLVMTRHNLLRQTILSPLARTFLPYSYSCENRINWFTPKWLNTYRHFAITQLFKFWLWTSTFTARVGSFLFYVRKKFSFHLCRKSIPHRWVHIKAEQ